MLNLITDGNYHPYHVNKLNGETYFLDHSVHVGLKNIELILNTLAEWTKVNFTDAKSQQTELYIHRNTMAELAFAVGEMHDVAYCVAYNGNEAIGANLASGTLNIAGYSRDLRLLAFESIIATDVFGAVINEEDRQELLRRNVLSLLTVISDLTYVWDPVLGSSYIHNYLFNLECRNNREAVLHENAIEWSQRDWIDDAEKFFKPVLEKYSQIAQEHEQISNKDYLKDMFARIEAKLNDSTSWLNAFELLQKLEKNYPDHFYPVCAAVQGEDEQLLQKVKCEMPEEAHDLVDQLWNLPDAVANRERKKNASTEVPLALE